MNKAESQAEALFLQKDKALKALQPANFHCVLSGTTVLLVTSFGSTIPWVINRP